MRIGIDARSLHYEGVGRYVQELLKYLARIDRKNEYIVYFSSQKTLKENHVAAPNFCNTILPVIYTLRKQPYVWYRLYKDKLDVFHSTHYWTIPLITKCRLVSTIHDTYIKTIPGMISYKSFVYGTLVMRIALTISDRVIAISRFMEKEIVNFYPKASGKISVIYHGVGEDFKPLDELKIVKVKKEYGINKRYLLYVGSLRPHKNVSNAIRAFSQLPLSLRKGTDLVIAARLDPRFSQLVRLPTLLGVEDRVRFLGYVPTENLAGLYCGAEGFILPSIMECFGFPMIEAMACGTPVMASHGGAIPEIGDNAAIYFDPESVENMKEVIESVLVDEGLRKKLSNMGLKRSREFSWEFTARRTLRVYEEVCQKE